LLNREPQSRDALANLMWSEYDQSHARAALRRTLSVLNRALGGNFLDADRETITLANHARLHVDVAEFRALVARARADAAQCIAHLTAAARIYRADFLAGFSLRDAPNFDEWQFFQSENLRRDFSTALEQLVRHYFSADEYSTSMEYARRWLALDPLHEPAHRALMELYAASGQRAAALRQYRECARVLGKELGVAPLEETTRAYEEIKSSNRRVRGQNAAEEKNFLFPISSAPTPFVGRAQELKNILDAYANTRDAQWIVIEGEAGIGKTRLAEELLRRARAQNAAIISARCYEGETQLAFAPFVQTLRAAFNHSRDRVMQLPVALLAEAARLLPEIAARRADLPAVPPLDNAGAQARFFESIAQIFSALAPRIFFIDDLQWADESSLDLLAFLLRRAHGERILFLATWRSEEIRRAHRLRGLLANFLREKRATVISLARLDRAAVQEWIYAIDHLPNDALELLYRETEGLPFFVAEYLAALAQSNHALDWSLPPSARALIESRLARAGQIESQLLTAAAIIGRSFDLDTLRAASGRSEEEIVSALENLIAQGLIREERAAYDFTHDKFRALVVEQTTIARRQLLHRRVAESLLARGRGEIRARASQIAPHFLAAGAEREAAHYFQLAGDHARDLFANAEALAHYRAALALGDGDAAKLNEGIGDLQTLVGDYRAALAAYESAAARQKKSARIEHKIGNVYQRRGENEIAAEHYRAARAALGRARAPAERARICADVSLAAHQRGDHKAARVAAERALVFAKKTKDARALAQTHNLLGILARQRGELNAARVHLETSRALAEKLNDPNAQIAALNNLALVVRARGDHAHAIALTEHALKWCVQIGDRHREAALHNNLADLFHASNEPARAMDHLKHAVAIFAEIGGEEKTSLPEIWKLVEW
ncbi:MAG: AAA family ATPase, partial [Chloroflexi bacterium]|nr:AAA family ATPase [Chloroflexota bacterium]